MSETSRAISLTATADAVLTTKLFVPPWRPNLVPRPQLIERLNQGLSFKSSVTVIAAPPGFGKTTLLSEWMAGARQRMVWLSLDEHDNDPARFLAYGLAALGQTQPFSPIMTTECSSFLWPLIQRLIATPEELLFVLDDYHTIQSPTIHGGMALLLDNLPPHCHLTIASRTEPPLPLARLRSQGRLTYMTATDLAFTPAEVAIFLNQVMQLDLAPDEIEALASRTEGWIAGLQMAALSMQGLADTAGFIKSFTGTHRHIFDYLTEEVLSRQPEPVQQFLLRTSILNRISGPLCDAILDAGPPEHGPPDTAPGPRTSQACLEDLERANLFIFPLDNERRWYRYHPLLADLLRDRLERQASETEIAGLHRRASAWFEQQGLAAEALRHALEALDLGRIINLVKQKAAPYLSRGELNASLHWLESLPPELTRNRERVPLLSAWAEVLTGRLENAMARLQALEQQLKVLDAGVSPTVTPYLRGEMAAIQAFVAYFQRDMAQAAPLFGEALRQLPGDNLYLRGIVIQSLGTALSWSGQIEPAIQAYTESSRINRMAGNRHITQLACWSLGLLRTEQGRLEQALDSFRRALPLSQPTAAQESPEHLPNPGRLHISLAEVLYQRNELSVAQQEIMTGLASVTGSEDSGVLAGGYLVLARLKQAQGDHRAAVQAIQEAVALAQSHPGPLYWTPQIAAYRAWLWLTEDNLQAVEIWARERSLWPLAVPERIPYLREAEYLLLVRLYLAQAQATRPLHRAAPRADRSERLQARLILSRIESAARAGGRTARLIEVLVLQALALTQEDDAERLACLDEALALAAPEGFVRVFVDEGPRLSDLLHRLVGQGTPQKVFANKILAAFHTAAPTGLLDSLSERELEILQLMATGMSNQALAETLILTVGTIKWHLNNIYGKLGVRSRTEAVARARELGLL
jgi:LuxR family maltose regulon positive regulatory protein